MDEFYGREAELQTLEECYTSGGAVLIYGRRRIGKTYLIEHFCQDKRYILFRCINGPREDNLEYFHQMIESTFGTEMARYRGYLDFFNDLGRICRESKTVIALDEYQYLTAVDKTVDSYVQNFIDAVIGHSNSMLILCGSSVSTMKARGEDGKNPLFGRFRRTMHIGPMPFADCRHFHPGMSDEDQLRLYLTIGGIPRYHRELSEPTYRECVIRNYLGNRWMLEEAQAPLGSEFRNAGRMSLVLSAVCSGAVTLKEISERLDEDDSVCQKAIRELCGTGILERLNPMMGAPKRGNYVVRDDLFAFNYEVLVRRRSLIYMNDAERTYDALKPHIDMFLGKRFEFFCRDLILENYPVTEIGTWWMDDSRRGVHEDIDIVAKIREGDNKIDLFAECKFVSRKVGFREYNILDSRVDRFRRDSNERLMLMSVSGFDDDLIDFAGQAGVLLAGPDELFGRRDLPKMV